MLLQPLTAATAKQQTKHWWQSTFSLLLQFYYDPPPRCDNIPTPVFESLDLSALWNLAEHPSVAPEYCWKVLADRVTWCFSLFRSPLHMFLEEYTHSLYDRQSLPFRTKPAQPQPHKHTALQVSVWTNPVCGNSPISLAQGWISQITWLRVPAADIKMHTAASFLRRVTEAQIWIQNKAKNQPDTFEL